MALEWLFVACWGLVIWSIYVIIVERTYTSESMNPRPCFLLLQYRLRSLLPLVTLLFLYFSVYKNPYLPSILHLYHHLFSELVHLYNLPLYWVCWGHKRLFVIWLQGCLRETSFIYASHGLINLRSSTWAKFATILQTSALGGPTTSTRRRLCSRHQSPIHPPLVKY